MYNDNYNCDNTFCCLTTGDDWIGIDEKPWHIGNIKYMIIIMNDNNDDNIAYYW